MTVPTSPSSSTSSGDDPLEVRQRAFDLLNRMGPEADDDENTWPLSPAKGPRLISSYQHGADHRIGDAAREAAYHVEEDEDSWGGAAAVQGFVQCLSDACKMGAAEIVSQNASFARSGYQTLKSVIVSEAQDRMSSSSSVERPRGSFESVPVATYHRGGGGR
jgi:hypothetical protein